jgi:hypothetical protein
MPGEQLLLINPRRRRVKKSHRRRAKNSRRRSHARSAGGYRIRRRRVKNPRSHKRRARHRNPVMRKRYRRRHRNPMSLSGVKSAIVPALMGAVGGVAVDYAYTAISSLIPTTLSSALGAYTGPVIKIGGAFGLGLVARKFLGSDKGNAVMAGALAIQVYNLIAQVVGGTSGLAGFGAYLAPNNPGQVYSSSVSRNGLGSPNPAVYLQRPLGRMRGLRGVGAYITNTPMSGLPFGGLGGLGGTQADMEMFS